MKRTLAKNGNGAARPRPPMMPTGKKVTLSPAAAKSQDRKSNGRETAAQMGASASAAKNKSFTLAPKLLIQMHDAMVRARVLEERLIRMYKKNDGYFWLGGPGEEAFQIPLAMMIKKGQGLDYDFMHFHYRATPTILTMGANPMDFMRQMKNTATDPFSGGRNFAAHTSIRAWNIVPITSTIETQYLTAIGTGIAQKRHGGDAITIVTGGDAGTAEGDFASSLVWSSRPGNELPMLIIVTNNQFGISTPACTQHGDKVISDRGKAFGMRTATINGNDVESAWYGLKDAIDYVRKERKPFLLEVHVSRLYGHSSATGANLVAGEDDPIAVFESQLEAAGILTRKEMEQLREKYNEEMLEMSKQVVEEPMPDPSTIYDHTYCGQKGRYW